MAPKVPTDKEGSTSTEKSKGISLFQKAAKKTLNVNMLSSLLQGNVSKLPGKDQVFDEEDCLVRVPLGLLCYLSRYCLRKCLFALLQMKSLNLVEMRQM